MSNQQINLADFLISIDENIKFGKIHFAQSQLLSLKKSEIDFRHWYNITDLARRAQMPFYVLNWLNSIVRPVKEADVGKAKPMHFTLYANALTRIGSFQEAGVILKSIEPEEDDQLYFYLALLDMQQWDYKKAVEHLKKYIKVPRLPDYRLKIGLLNLASALAAENDYTTSIEILDQLVAESPKNSLIRANCLETLGQNLFHLRQFASSKESLNQAIEIYSLSTHTYRYYAEKWLLFNHLFEKSNLNENDFQLMAEFRKRALHNRQWETVRDCDYYKACLTRDQDLLFKIYFGTRFKSYNRRILNQFEFNKKVPEQYTLKIYAFPFSNDKSATYLIDRTNGWLDSSQKTFIDGLPLKLFSLLTRDIYLPFHFGEIFAHLYHNEYFNPQSSPQKISRIFQRLRENLKESQIPIELVVDRKQVYFKYLENVEIRIRKSNRKTPKIIELNQLMSRFNDQFFSSAQAQILLKMSQRNTRRVLQVLVKEKYLFIRHAGNKTTYRVLSKATRLVA